MNYPVFSNRDYDKVAYYSTLPWKVLCDAGLNSRGTIFTKSGQYVCFADIIARTFGTVVELYTRPKREAAKVGLVVNAANTQYMLVHDV